MTSYFFPQINLVADLIETESGEYISPDDLVNSNSGYYYSVISDGTLHIAAVAIDSDVVPSVNVQYSPISDLAKSGVAGAGGGVTNVTGSPFFGGHPINHG